MTLDEMHTLMSDPLLIQFALKERGSNFSQIARDVSTPEREISPHIVRYVVYMRTAHKHHDLIMSAIEKTLSRPPIRRSFVADSLVHKCNAAASVSTSAT